MLKRIGTANTDGHVAAMRGVLHGAMALYLTRYLNVPSARIPGDRSEKLDDLPTDAETIRVTLRGQKVLLSPAVTPTRRLAQASGTGW
jgi:hypothetical protein